MTSLIETEPDLKVCAEAATRSAALEAIESAKPDLVITDLSLKKSDGLELVKDIHQRHPLLPVLVLSMHDESIYAERALRAGASGYLTKEEMDDTVLLAIRRVLAGELHTSDLMSRKFAQKFLHAGKFKQGSGLELLSDRELEVFKLIGRGIGTCKIAQALGVSVKTIETYRENLKFKLDLTSGAALSRSAILWHETGRLG